MNIVQIVPRLPPYTDGVGDYSIRLANQLLKGHGIATQFLVVKQGIKTEPLINGFPATGIPAPTPEAFLSVLPKDIEVILLQYSNYPYLAGKLDAPWWLLTGLQAAMKQRSIKLVVMFHELPTLKFKNLNFLNPIQSMVSYCLAQIATKVLTNNSRFQRTLSQWIKRPVTCIPNFSTIAEPDCVLPLTQRQRRMIVFGGSDRHRVYKNCFKELLYSCQVLEIEEIYDVGKPLNLHPSDFKGVRLVEMGFQPAQVVSQLMLNSWAGFLDYSRFPGALCKSTVFAAFCAHGLIPICSCYESSEANGLEMNQHYLVPDQLKDVNLMQLQTVADNANKWYNIHNLTESAKVFASSILG